MSQLVDNDRIRSAWLKDQEREPRPQDHNWISGAGDVCDRRLVLQRLHWQDVAPPSEYLKAVFKRGNIAEREIGRRQMIEAGYEFAEPQAFRIVEQGEVVWSGRTDGSVRDKDAPIDTPFIPWEAKMLNTHVWKRIDTLDDMIASKSPYIRGLPAQLMLYLYAKGTNERGIFHLMDSETWMPKHIDVTLDYEYVQWLIERGKRINLHVAAEDLPDPIEWSDDICGRCRLLHVCMPDQIRKFGTLRVWELPGFEEKLELLDKVKAELKPLEDQKKELESHVKGLIRRDDGTQFAIGNFLITKKSVSVKGYEVAPRVDERIEIKRVGAKAMEKQA